MAKVKKEYKKPNAEFVDFSMSSNIASTCRYDAQLSDGMTCGYEDNGLMYFSDFNICFVQVENGEFCYHAPLADNSIFGS